MYRGGTIELTKSVEHTPVKWRELRAYLSSVTEAYPGLQFPVGSLILATLAQPSQMREGREQPLVLANLNDREQSEIEEDAHLQTIFTTMPGIHTLIETSGLKRTAYNARVTSALGFHTLRFTRSRVPAPDDISGRLRTIYSMTSSPSDPLY